MSSARTALLFVGLMLTQIMLSLASPHSKWESVINNCRVDAWQSVYDPSVMKRALSWCESEDQDDRNRVSSLMLNMKQNSPRDVRVVPATAFDSNVRVYYMPALDEFFINPLIVEKSAETKWYQCGVRKPPLHTWVRLSYLDGGFKRATRVLSALDAQAMQCELLH
jgi:hypothetical protein